MAISRSKKGKRKVVSDDDTADEVHEMDDTVSEARVRDRKPRKKRRPRKDRLAELEDYAYYPDTENLEWKKWERELDHDLEKFSPWGDNDDEKNPIKKKQIPDQRETPAELVMPLLPFQKEFLAWSMNQEETSAMRGGVLADEMGMGKTVQAISLILAGRAAGHGHGASVPSEAYKSGEKPCCSSQPVVKQLPAVKATLVVCPLVAVIQWKKEIERFTKDGSLKVLIYHGNRKHITLKELSDNDVVLTTYSLVECDHRNKVMPPKIRCKWCNKLFLPHRIDWHLKYYCGPDAEKSEKQAKQMKKKSKYTEGTTADEAPEDSFWEEPSERKKRKRGVSAEALDLACKSAIDSTEKRPNGSSLLHSVKWVRIILDEAHSIKDRSSSTAKAIFALQSCYKWALSGTPLQNRVGELYSLVRFLEVEPYSYFFCKKCDCKSLDYMGGKCEKCDHASVSHFCWWNKYIANPIKKFGFTEGLQGGKAMNLLKYKLLDEMLLRRTKVERAADLAIPPKAMFWRKAAFDAREQDFYKAVYNQTHSEFSTYVKAGTVLNNYAHIFDLLTRLRQAVDHPYLVCHSAKDSPQATCGICHDISDDPVSASCGDTFCRSCLEDYMSGEATLNCPSCQNPLTVDLTTNKKLRVVNNVVNNVVGYRKTSIINRIDLDKFQTSTKIEALKEEVMKMLRRDKGAKAIVFSQFTSMLDLIGFAFDKAGLKCVKLDGSMGMAQRDKMIESFKNDPDCTIFLMSLKAGGVALNLTVASHIFLMDPWWNPAVEQQAQDRIHRIGQYKPIRVTRFVIEDTIEERILALQEKKQLVFEGTVGGSSEALDKLTVQDLQFLFTS